MRKLMEVSYGRIQTTRYDNQWDIILCILYLREDWTYCCNEQSGDKTTFEKKQPYQIHPFSDGNGRMARLWHTAILSKWKQIFEYIPIESQIEKFQDEYYDAIAKCHVDGSFTGFIEFMLAQIDKILDEVSVQFGDDSG